MPGLKHQNPLFRRALPEEARSNRRIGAIQPMVPVLPRKGNPE